MNYRDFSAMVDTYLLFGKYPSQLEVDYLESIGITTFVDVTEEPLDPYAVSQSSRVIKYPIKDRCPPSPLTSFNKLIARLVDEVENKSAVLYIHCRGGHGRSALVAACLWMALTKCTPLDALTKVKAAHQQRQIMDDRWRMGAPQTKTQLDFVRSFRVA